MSEKERRSKKLQFFLIVLFVIVFMFALYVAFSSILFPGITGFVAKDMQDTKDMAETLGDKISTLTIDEASIKECCVFETEQGPKRCIVTGERDCSWCASYCGG